MCGRSRVADLETLYTSCVNDTIFCICEAQSHYWPGQCQQSLTAAKHQKTLLPPQQAGSESAAIFSLSAPVTQQRRQSAFAKTSSDSRKPFQTHWECGGDGEQSAFFTSPVTTPLCESFQHTTGSSFQVRVWTVEKRGFGESQKQHMHSHWHANALWGLS